MKTVNGILNIMELVSSVNFIKTTFFKLDIHIVDIIHKV